jgi:hypothetical protein
MEKPVGERVVLEPRDGGGRMVADDRASRATARRATGLEPAIARTTTSARGVKTPNSAL